MEDLQNITCCKYVSSQILNKFIKFAKESITKNDKFSIMVDSIIMDTHIFRSGTLK